MGSIASIGTPCSYFIRNMNICIRGGLQIFDWQTQGEIQYTTLWVWQTVWIMVINLVMMLQRSGIQGGTLIYCYWDTGMASTFPWSHWRPRWSAPVLRVWCNRNTEGHLKLAITPVPATTLESVSWFWVTAAGPGQTFQIAIFCSHGLVLPHL